MSTQINPNIANIANISKITNDIFPQSSFDAIIKGFALSFGNAKPSVDTSLGKGSNLINSEPSFIDWQKATRTVANPPVTATTVDPKVSLTERFSKFTKSDTGKVVSGAVNTAVNTLSAFAPQLDNVSTASSVLDTVGDLAGNIPVYGWIAKAALKGVNAIDKFTGKAAKQQATAGASALGYNLDTNTSAGTTYGGLFGNKARKNSNTLSNLYDSSNIKKISASYNATQNQLAAQNNVQDVYQKNMQKLVGGIGTKTISAKKGGKLNPAKLRNVVKKANLIPEGALHARKHDLPEELKDKVTNKGIPVVTYTDGGDITQHAEIEVNEIIFAKETTTKLEELYKKYNDTESQSEKDKLAIEAGKFLTTEILENTDDKTGLLNEI